MIDYLYYKLYQAILKSSLRDIPRIIAPVFIGGLISVNLLVINAFLAKVDIMPFLFSNKKQAIILAIVLIVLAFMYYRDVKINDILERYSREGRPQRIKGNIVVSIYVAASFLLIFAVTFFRPGKL